VADNNQVLEFLSFVEGQGQTSLKRMLEKVLEKSRELTHAEAGTIFLVRTKGKARFLEPMSMQNDAIRVRKRDFIVPVGKGTIAGYVAHSGRIVRIDDVYDIPRGRSYRFDPAFEHPSYKTTSMFSFPLKNLRDEVIGVVQLINRKPARRKTPVPFPESVEELVMPIAATIGHSIERARMMERIKQKNQALRDRNRRLDEQRQKIVDLQAETEDAFQLSIKLLATASEIHDEETGNHIVRVNEYSYFLAKRCNQPDRWCDEIRYSAQLHDVGKMSVDSAVLKKKGRLDPDERAEMDRHTVYGYKILKESPRLAMGAEIALHHHEKWDGTGYPNRVAGDAIPLSARIVQMADVYDALRSERPYKPAFSHDMAVSIITKGDDRLDPNGHFDPALIELFAHEHEEFDRIWTRLAD